MIIINISTAARDAETRDYLTSVAPNIHSASVEYMHIIFVGNVYLLVSKYLA